LCSVLREHYYFMVIESVALSDLASLFYLEIKKYFNHIEKTSYIIYNKVSI
jgi:hypothetical protein